MLSLKGHSVFSRAVLLSLCFSISFVALDEKPDDVTVMSSGIISVWAWRLNICNRTSELQTNSVGFERPDGAY